MRRNASVAGVWEMVAMRLDPSLRGVLGDVGRPRTITGAAANIITGPPVILCSRIREHRMMSSRTYLY